ncbi:hypothetical protein FB45DRAFT_942480 [Roridomyces roridus]|uniref:Uncharacterized protein n=1 Tax=Roridomyces roridus TaxID=1738132 RepID=A0AAD7FBP4_9AGAR|nr:hypothetical protein FB45DRAFT_942480 [Roridomyces roridus]
MLRRRRSLAALTASLLSSNDEAPKPDEEDDVPPLPTGLQRATMRTIPRTAVKRARKDSDEKDGSGLMRRMSSLLFRSSSSSSTGSNPPAKNGSNKEDMDASTTSSRSKSTKSSLKKKTKKSKSKPQPPKPRSPTPSDAEDDSEDDIRRPSGLGPAASLRSLSPSPSPEPEPDLSRLNPKFPYDSPGASTSAAALQSFPASDSLGGEAEAERYVTPWTRYASNANANGTPRVRAVSSPASTLLHTLLRLPEPPRPPAPVLPASIWRRCRPAYAAGTCRNVCQAVWRVVDLRSGMDDGAMEGREVGRWLMRVTHVAACVEGVVCEGWPPWSGAYEGHQTLERLAVIGGNTNSASDDCILEDTSPGNTSFLPRLTHLHAPPALAIVLLERIAGAPADTPLSTPVASESAPPSPVTKADAAPSTTPKSLSPASLALLAPDPKEKEKKGLHLPGWHRVRSHNAEVEAMAGEFLNLEQQREERRLSMVEGGEGQQGRAVTPASIPAMTTTTIITSSPTKSTPPRRIPRKPPPKYEDAALVEMATVVTPTRARAVFLHAPAAPVARVVSGPERKRSAVGVGSPHPLRVLRIAVLQAVKLGHSNGSGSRTDVAVPSAAPSADGLALHLVFGSRVDRRTLEKVLRTLGSGLAEVPVVPPLPPIEKSFQVKTPPSSWPGRGRTDPREEQEAEKSGPSVGIEVLEVRSAVRVAELRKIMSTVLPRYPTLRKLLLSRPPRPISVPGSQPPSPRSPSFFFPSPPATPGFLTSSSRPSSVISRAPPSVKIPHSPSPSPSPPASPQSTLAVPPGLAGGRNPAYLSSPVIAPPPKPAEDDGWTWDLRFEGEGESDDDDDEGTGVLSSSDAALVGAWRRHCAELECVRMVSGAWWMREE